MGDFVKDPVCGMPVASEAPHRITHAGRDYRFCSSFCRDAFLQDSAGVLARAPADGDKARRADRAIAYFTMEIALESAMATYSGGLGVLAGDTIRACADLGVRLVAVTLLHREGYLTQHLDPAHGQLEEPQRWALGDFVRPLPETVEVTLEGRTVRVRAWMREVRGAGEGTVPVLFLDTDLEGNTAFDRSLTGRLYGGDEWYRLCQEIILGVGGVRMLGALGYGGIKKIHLNEGHAAFAPLELGRQLAQSRGPAQWPFEEVRQRCVFTTHTPIAAGHDQFSWEVAERALGDYLPREIERMEAGADRLNMTSLALNLSGFVNGVAKKHAEVSRAMFPGYGVQAITNGIHPATWASPPLAALFDRHVPGWRADGAMLRNVLRIPPADVEQAHLAAKAALASQIETMTGRVFDPTVFTIGFARRATAYKRVDLAFSDVERLKAVRARGGQLQFVFAGKAHPRDEPGKAAIRRVLEIARVLGDDIPVVFLPNYEMDLARIIVAGVDLWLNTPHPPLEASGTSGMKAALNGVPSLSVLDGWWLEGHIEGVTGWSLGAQQSGRDGDAHDAEELCAKLDGAILPTYYRRREAWMSIMQHAIALNGSFFNTHRMVQQYVTNAYA